jgi:hypothetical protein
MLVAAYARQFGNGDHLDWMAWAQEVGCDRDTAGRVLDGLQDRYLVAAVGGRLQVSASGAELVERGFPADPELAALIERQFALRRKILGALNDLLLQQGTLGVLRAARIAGTVGETTDKGSKMVLVSLFVLRDYFLITTGDDDRGAFRIAADGRDALSAAQQRWPLSGA